MTTAIHEPVSVGAVFEQGVVRPAWFLWQRRRIAVKQVTLRWHTKEGAARVLHLGVSDGANTFELQLNQETLRWSLAAVEPDASSTTGSL
jgi:hypothetical protein